MADEKKDKLFAKMKRSLHIARDIRKVEMGLMDQKLYDQMSFADMHNMGMTERWRKTLQEASSRRMLAEHKFKDKDGNEKRGELLYVKTKEPYHKRPSVRAQRADARKSKDRDNDSGGWEM